MQAIRIHHPGGPEVLELDTVPIPTPGAGQVLIKVAAAGVNYADTGMRAGMMFGPHQTEFPFTPGFEVAGTVAALGPGVTTPAEGTRVVAVLDAGGYAEYAVADAARVLEVPAGVDFNTALTVFLVQGLTAYGVLHDAAKIQPGESVLVQAAAGGVGSLAVQLARLAGARPVIGAASSPAKRELVLRLGADHAIDYTRPGWVEQLRELTQGRGVDVVLESVGGEVGAQSFRALAPLGRFVMFGAASGPFRPPLDLMQLNVGGQSLVGYGGPWLRPGAAARGRAALAEYLERDQLQIVRSATFTLANAADAHRAIAERSTTGKVLLEVAPES